MNKTKTYIELNGATYDASTGHLVGHVAAPATNGQAMDGVVRRPTAAKSAAVPEAVNRPKQAAGSHKTAKPAKRRAQRSQTLMRQAVHKPTLGDLFHAKTAPLSAGSNAIVHTARRSATVNPQRASRAQAVAKSGLVSKFGTGKLLMRMAHLPVAEPPSKSTAKHVHQAATQAVFSKELDQARSHEQPKLKKQRVHQRLAHKLHISPRSLNIGAGIMAAVLIGSFFLYQNIPNLSIRLAAARAGFHASLPSYQPSGFAIKGPIEYATGELTVNFQSNSDSRNFQVKQQVSNWNSETLLQAYVSKQKQPYQTYEEDGRVVYIDNTSANLVTGNKWVQVKSDGSLSTEQLLNIVKSIN